MGLPPTIPAALLRAAEQVGDREALIDGGSRWTFADLADAALRSAGAMIAAGVEPSDRVAMWAPNGRLFVAAALGAVTAGAVLVPLNTRFKGDEAAWILRRSGARLLVTNGWRRRPLLTFRRDRRLDANAPAPLAFCIRRFRDG